MMKGIQIPGFLQNPGIFCRKNLHEGCETLREMGNLWHDKWKQAEAFQLAKYVGSENATYPSQLVIHDNNPSTLVIGVSSVRV